MVFTLETSENSKFQAWPHGLKIASLDGWFHFQKPQKWGSDGTHHNITLDDGHILMHGTSFRSSVIQAGTTLVGHVHRISSFLRGLWSTSQPWRCIQVWSTSRHRNVQNDKQNTEQVRHQNQKICPVIDEFEFYFCKKTNE